jgi:ferredoxin-type protein NapH
VVKYRHSTYQVVRTGSIVFFQLIFAFMIPSLLAYFREPERYPSFFWPLSYKDIFPETVHSLMTHPGQLGKFLLLWSILLAFVATPILTYFFGKRWYCSWVCGCGGLANTLGDPWRQLSNKSLKAWKVERITIYSILVLITVTTGLLWVGAWSGPGALQSVAAGLKQFYGFTIGMVFSGVIGTGFYPLMGTRVWCRFGCPQAAILGILQRYFSRFRITTNGAQCISCGNCSTYCEMGIDVRAYAQKGQNIVRASCVGCGLCSAVCPRGVLNLENGPREGRIHSSLSLTDELKAG